MGMFRDSIKGLGSSFGALFFRMLFLWGTSRFLGPELRGEITYLGVLPRQLVAFSHLGLGTAFMYFVPKGEFTLHRVAKNALTIGLLLGLVTFVIGMCIHQIPLILGGKFDWMMTVALAGLPFMIWRQYFQKLQVALKQMNTVVFSVVCLPALPAIVMAVMVFVFKVEALLPVVLGVVAGNVIGAIAVMWRTYRDTTVSVGMDRDFLRRAILYSLMSWAFQALAALLRNIDVFFINYMLSKEHLGIYSPAAGVLTLAITVPASIQNILFPRVAEDAQSGAAKAALVSRMTTLVMLCLCVFMVPAVWAIPWIFGQEYRPAVSVGFLLMPGIVFQCTYQAITTYYNASGKIRVSIGFLVVACLASAGLRPFLLPWWGLNGSAVATSLVGTLLFVGLGLRFSREQKIPFRSLLIPSWSEVTSLARRLLRRKKKPRPQSPSLSQIHAAGPDIPVGQDAPPDEAGLPGTPDSED